MEDILKNIKALADENRLKIIKLLLYNNLCVGALAKKLQISESAVSQQLKILREADLVMGEKKGYFVHYKVKNEKLQNLGRYIIELSDEKCDENGCCQ